MSAQSTHVVSNLLFLVFLNWRRASQDESHKTDFCDCTVSRVLPQQSSPPPVSLFRGLWGDLAPVVAGLQVPAPLPANFIVPVTPHFLSSHCLPGTGAAPPPSSERLPETRPLFGGPLCAFLCKGTWGTVGGMLRDGVVFCLTKQNIGLRLKVLSNRNLILL